MEGWKCPECGRINALFVDHCPCKDNIKITLPVSPYVYPIPVIPYYPWPNNPWDPWDGYIKVTCDGNTVNYSISSNKTGE